MKTPNKSILALLMAGFMMLPVASLAQGKIAVLDAQQAIFASAYAQARLEELRQQPDVQADVKKLETLQAEFASTYEQQQKEGASMSAEQREAAVKTLSSTRADIEHVSRKLQAAEQQFTQALVAEMGERLQAVVQSVIQTDGIGLLLDRGSVMHADSGYDITARVTAELDRAGS